MPSRIRSIIFTQSFLFLAGIREEQGRTEFLDAKFADQFLGVFGHMKSAKALAPAVLSFGNLAGLTWITE